jgi:hypothetical protein
MASVAFAETRLNRTGFDFDSKVRIPNRNAAALAVGRAFSGEGAHDALVTPPNT